MKNRRFWSRSQKSVFYQIQSSTTSYHARNNWLQYRINLVTTIPTNFQQKTNLALGDQLAPQIVIRLSACARYYKWCLFYVVSYFCSINKFYRVNPIEGNKHKISEINKTMIVIIAIYST